MSYATRLIVFMLAIGALAGCAVSEPGSDGPSYGYQSASIPV
jgi:hypothetical protein